MNSNGSHVGNGALAMEGRGVQTAMDCLNPKQKSFVLAYLDSGGNGRQAANLAGYGKSYGSSGVLGHYLLKNVNVRAAIKEAYRQLGMDQDEVVGRLAEYVRANPENFFDSKWRIKRSELKKRGHLVRKLKAPSKGRPAEIEMHDGMAALVHIGRSIGMFADKLELGCIGGGPLQIQLSVAPKEITG